MALTSGGEIQLLPAGSFRAIDGRPTDAPYWSIDAIHAQCLVVAASARANPYVIDYEHQTLLSKENGKPAPAAGWFKKLEWRDGVGLFATDVQWTAAARDMIDAGEYKFISPVLAYAESGVITGLWMAAITNNPAISGMDEVMLAAASQRYAALTNTVSTPQEYQMEEILESLRWMLNLPLASTPADILAQLTKLGEMIKQNQDGTAAAATCDLGALISSQRAAIAALSATTPDPAKYVAASAMHVLQGKVASLSAELNAKNIDDVVKKGEADGKLIPAMIPWARAEGAKNLVALSAMIDAMPAIAALTGTQTGGTAPVAAGTSVLTSNQAALCSAFGVAPEQFLATARNGA